MPNMGFRGIYAAANSALGGRITAGDLIPSFRGGMFPFYEIGSDPYFEYNSLLLKAIGTDSQQNLTYLDSSSNNFAITKFGVAAHVQGTFSPFAKEEGNWSAYFDGTGDYLSNASAAAANFGTGDFTFECWVYFTNMALDNYYQVFTTSNSTGGFQIYKNAGSSNIVWDINSTSTNLIATNIVANRWYHIAVTRSGSTVRTFLDGVLTYTYTNSFNFTITGAYIGAFPTGVSYFPGYISNLRIVKGTAVYTSEFTPSTEPLTAISGTSLLTCQSNRFKDNSTNNFTITANGDARVTPFAPFNPSSSYSVVNNIGSSFEGVLQAASSTAFGFGSGNFTIEFWIYTVIATWGADARVVDFGNASGNLNLTVRGGLGVVNETVSHLIQNSGVYPDRYQWNHIAFTRSGTTLRIFKNGVQVATTTSSVGNASGSLIFNSNGNYVNDFRIVKGTALYTSNFTPPTQPLTNIAGTSVLLKMSNSGILDASRQTNVVPTGNIPVSSNIFKYSKSMYFDGEGGDYLSVPSNTSAFYNLSTGDFTIETWCYQPNINSGTRVLSALSPYSTGNSGYAFYLNAGYAAWFVNGSNRIVSTNPVTASEWTHVAVVRSSGITKMYFNGVQTGSSYTDGTNYSGTFYVGSDTTQHYLGYMEDFRVTRYARYTENFTPPSGPLLTR